MILLSLELPSERTTVYNFTIAPTATYLVGGNRVWVHNEKPCDPSILISTYQKAPFEWTAVASQRVPSTNVRNKGGWSLVELLEDSEGHWLERHTLLRSDGSVFEPPHVRPVKLKWGRE